MARHLIDLSTPMTTGHFRWPVERRLLKSHAEGAGQGTWAGWNVHGFTPDAISLDMTVGDAAILDLSDVPENTAITGERIAAAGAHLRRGDIAILKTRWDERASIDTPDFWARSPWMTAEAAIWLREAGIK